MMVAGTQGGKTTFGPWWLAREIARRGPGDYLAVSSTVDLARLKMLPALRECFEWHLRWGMWKAGERTLELHDPATGIPAADGKPWARIILRSAAAGGGLESATAKAAWLDECGQDEFTVETWEAVLRRLSLARGRVLGTTTPYNLGWLKTEVYDRWKAGDADFDVVQYGSALNPSFPQEEVERARATMPEWRFRMFYEGRFERPAGAIYDCYVDEPVPHGHRCPAFTPDPAWPRYVGLDFGGVHTAAVFLAAELERNPNGSWGKPTGKHYLYREYLAGGRTSKEHAAALTAGEPGIAACVGGSGSEGQWRREFAQGGLAVQEPPITGADSVEVGIARTYEGFKLGNLIVCESCAGVRGELNSYRREVDDQGNPTEKIVDKDSYHRLDALRYIGSLLWGGRGRVQTITRGRGWH